MPRGFSRADQEFRSRSRTPTESPNHLLGHLLPPARPSPVQDVLVLNAVLKHLSHPSADPLNRKPVSERGPLSGPGLFAQPTAAAGSQGLRQPPWKHYKWVALAEARTEGSCCGNVRATNGPTVPSGSGSNVQLVLTVPQPRYSSQYTSV